MQRSQKQTPVNVSSTHGNRNKASMVGGTHSNKHGQAKPMC